MSNSDTSNQNADTPEEKAFRKILNWQNSKRCPEWQKDALRRLFSKGKLDEEDQAELLKICKGETSGKSCNNIPGPSAVKTVALTKISGIQHVNALDKNQKLEFPKAGLTIVYGDNGAGKSGYVRILKKACGTLSHHDDDIFPNIYEIRKEGPNPKAVISIDVDGQEVDVDWELESKADPRLAPVCVFDMRTASVHVDHENELVYKPAPLHIMSELAETCLRLNADIDKEIQTNQETPDFLNDPCCSPTSPVGELLQALSAETDEQSVEGLAHMTDADFGRLKELESIILDGPEKACDNILKLVDKIDGVKEFVNSIIERASDENIHLLRDLERKRDSERKAEEVARHELFSGEPLPDVGSDVWRNLWEAARLYSESAAYVEEPFPATENDTRCVLCQRDLDPDTSARLERFEEFVRGGARKRVRAAEQEYQKFRDALVEALHAIENLRQNVALIRGELKDPVLAASLRRACLVGLCRLRMAIRPLEKSDDSRMPMAESAPTDKLNAYRNILDRKAAAICGPEEWKRIQKKFEELRDRKWLNEVKEDVLDHIQRLKKIAALKISQETTNTREITLISSALADDLVTVDLKESFSQKFGLFNLKGVDIELQRVKSSYGNAKFRVRLTRKINQDVRVGQVLSDGEHQCVAFAAFFAELALNKGKSAIVFDEPAASLDQDHRETVAKQLSEESRNRQVVVFTHDKTFLGLLREVCQPKPGTPAIPIECRSLGRDDNYAGICISWPIQHPVE